VAHPLPDAPRGPLFALPGVLRARPSAASARITTLGFGRCKHLAPGSVPGGPYTRAVGRALVLNATHQPLAVVAARRAVILVLKDKAEVLVSNGQVFRSEHLHVDAPSVLRLRMFVKIPHRSHAPLTRRAVFARDEWACQYCGASAENLDHVVPRSRGGAHSWDNVVAACRRCNSRKENRLIEEVGLRLARRPVPPRDGFRLSIGRLEPEWEPYL
jgi:5-methylcytosine-specific restriction endonuclease McrA